MNRNDKKRWFLKIHVAIDVKSKQITGLDITDDKLHDSKHVISIVEQSKKFGNVTKVLSDDACDTKNDFPHLYGEEIIPGIKTRILQSTLIAIQEENLFWYNYSIRIYQRRV